VISRLGHVIWDVVNRDHPVAEDQDDKEENDEGEIAQKVHGGQLLVRCFGVEEHSSGLARRRMNGAPGFHLLGKLLTS
jgi:hypothetical protein